MPKKKTAAQRDVIAHDMLVSLQATIQEAFEQIAVAAEKLRDAQNMLDKTAGRRVARTAARKTAAKKRLDQPGVIRD